ncbi:P-loop containing nucleoside triphosphate hydrolase protein, partial [Xylogone sp. PMI_703]
MVIKPFQSDALDGLRSKEQLELLNAIDSLRSQGISRYVSLPQIIVCGDQSSGKSSVLEAISGVPFPVKSNLCTRFPIELVLRKTPLPSVNVSIVPHESRSKSEKIQLGSFHERLNGFEGLPTLIENAKAAMSISTHGKAFSRDLLRVEVSGPDHPQLTIVDLPGLIHSETKNQSEADIKLVQQVVRSYMEEPRSIILAVVSAKNDYANQIVLKLARAADKLGTRTLGVITKPDTLVPGSESESQFVALAENKDVHFHLGWHVLKNMDSEKGQSALAERDASEKEFFSNGSWTSLPQSVRGIEDLRMRLSKLLLGQISTELPGLINDIRTKIKNCRQRLDKLGTPRITVEDQRLYLLSISSKFQSLVQAAIDGTYTDPFFGSADSRQGYQRRIRAVIRNLSEDFVKDITQHGHKRQIVQPGEEDSVPDGVTPITREDFKKRIQQLMQKTRGRELPTTFNPMIVTDLFLEQSAPWEAITAKHIEKVWTAVKTFLSFISAYVADPETSKALIQQIFEPALSQLYENLKEKTLETLKPHKTGHPITISNKFTASLRTEIMDQNTDKIEAALKSFFGVSTLSTSARLSNSYYDLQDLLYKIVQCTLPDIPNSACSDALDRMEAYYKVALERFIDDIAVEAIEAKLITPLHNIFTPIAVTTMSTDLLAAIAGESDESRIQREKSTKQLDILTKGYETCERF